MKASELRIGNWVDYDGVELKVDEIICPKPLNDNRYSNKWLISVYMTTLTIPLDDCRPIPLTEEWLLKFGAQRGHIGWMFGVFEDDYVINGFNIIDESSGEERFYYFMEGICDIRVLFVHQLQNLYFALTGEELTIKETAT